MEKMIATENISIKTGINALLSIRDFENTKIKYLLQLNKIEAEIEGTNQTALSIIRGRSNSKSVEKVEHFIHEINEAANSLHKTMTALKIRIELRNRINSADLWNKLHIHLEKLKGTFEDLDDFGYTMLQDSEIAVWKKNMNNVSILIMPSIFSFIESSKLELKMIETFSFEDLNKILNNILSHFHKGFDFDEADSFESDYLVPLRDLEIDFEKEKKLWATFSAILNN